MPAEDPWDGKQHPEHRAWGSQKWGREVWRRGWDPESGSREEWGAFASFTLLSVWLIFGCLPVRSWSSGYVVNWLVPMGKSGDQKGDTSHSY